MSAFLCLLSTTRFTLTFHNSGVPGSYPITLALNPSASPSFIDFATKSSLDSSIIFQPATITVVPEPATLLPLLALPLLSRRRHPPSPFDHPPPKSNGLPCNKPPGKQP